MVSEKAFDSQRYPELLISFRSLKHQNTYSSDYEKKREQALNQVKEALKNRPEEQVAALRDSAQPDINQGRQALETENKHLRSWSNNQEFQLRCLKSKRRIG